MLKIGIIGSDNSHAIAYSKLANVEKIVGDTCRVVGIWGQEEARTKEVAKEGQIETMVAKPEDLLELVDAAIVVDRHGDLHAEHALPFLENGLPVYVDKPFAISLADCQKMLNAAEKSGSLLSSFSPLRVAPSTTAIAEAAKSLGEIKVAHFAGPCDFESQYAGPFFYATHVAEIAIRLLKSEVESLQASRLGKNVNVQVWWKNGVNANFSYLGDAAYHFHTSLFGTEKMLAQEIIGGYSSYGEVLKSVLLMIETKERPLSNQELLHPIAIVHAIEKSLDRDGAKISIKDVMN